MSGVVVVRGGVVRGTCPGVDVLHSPTTVLASLIGFTGSLSCWVYPMALPFHFYFMQAYMHCLHSYYVKKSATGHLFAEDVQDSVHCPLSCQPLVSSQIDQVS